jgi:hypothetical protein
MKKEKTLLTLNLRGSPLESKVVSVEAKVESVEVE